MAKFLIISTHPDDEVLSFGGLMAKAKRNKDEVYLHCFCVGGPCSNVDTDIRLSELRDVASFFGVKKLTFDLDWDGHLDQVPSCVLTTKIDKLIDKYKPDEVYCTAQSEHSDHQATVKAFMASARLKTGHMPKLFAIGTYPFSDQLYALPEGGKLFNVLSEEDFKMKCDGFRLHASQQKPSPSPLGIEGIRIQAEYYGMMCAEKYAELYYQIRYIKRH